MKRYCRKKKPLRDLCGRSYGRWSVVDKAGMSDHGMSLWNCVCSCGEKKVIRSIHLMSGRSKSCGCLRREVLKARHNTKAKRKASHG